MIERESVPIHRSSIHHHLVKEEDWTCTSKPMCCWIEEVEVRVAADPWWTSFPCGEAPEAGGGLLYLLEVEVFGAKVTEPLPPMRFFSVKYEKRKMEEVEGRGGCMVHSPLSSFEAARTSSVCIVRLPMLRVVMDPSPEWESELEDPFFT
jgi:hypothetical protein